MFVPLKDLVLDAQAKKYAVGAFNFSNLETLLAIVRAANKLSAPVIIQTSQSAIKYAGLEYIVAMAKAAAKTSGVPLALHLDHGTDLAVVMACIQAGYSSVMIDGSHLPLAENIAFTRKVVEAAHPLGVSVEAELGRLGGVEDEISVASHEVMYTDPEEACQFIEAVEVDALAVAIGTAHGQYHGEPKLDFQRLAEIAATISTPLVLHGASGIKDESIKKAVAQGVTKVNIDTDLRVAFRQAVKDFVDNFQDYDPRKILSPAIQGMQEVVAAKINLFGSAGKAVLK